MNKLLLPATFLLLVAMTAPKAATVDLTALTETTGTNSSATTTANASTLFGTASLSGSVAYVNSFEWDFTAGDFDIGGGIFDDYAYLTTSAGTIQLSDIAAVGSFGTSGAQTYTFAAPYSGSIILGVANVTDDEAGSTLNISNLITVVPPVPEPMTYVLLMTGLAFMTAVVRRNRRASATN